MLDARFRSCPNGVSVCLGVKKRFQTKAVNGGYFVPTIIHSQPSSGKDGIKSILIMTAQVSAERNAGCLFCVAFLSLGVEVNQQHSGVEIACFRG